MLRYIYKGKQYTDEELVDEAIQMNADVNNRDLSSEELQDIWALEVEILNYTNRGIEGGVI